MLGAMVVNVRTLDGNFVFGGVFHSLDSVYEVIGQTHEVTDVVKETVKRLWMENSHFGIPDYCGGLEISIKRYEND